MHSTLHILSSWEAAFKQWRDIFYLAYYRGMDVVNGMMNLESRSKKDEITRNAFKKLEGLYLPNVLQKVCTHMNLHDATIHSAQAHIDLLITEQLVEFYLDHLDNKELVSQTAGMRHFCGYNA